MGVENGSRHINETHAIISRWRRDVIPEKQLTPKGEYDRGLEEFRELHDEMAVYNGSPESGRKVSMEAVDVVIRMMGLIDSLGFDTESLMAEKMDIMYRKYNPDRTQKLTASGITWHDAMKMQKLAYERETATQ